MKSLPPLLLGNSNAKQGNSFDELMTLIDQELPSGWGSGRGNSAVDCKFRFGSLNIGPDKLLAFSMAPTRYDNAVSQAPVVSISFDGDFSYRSGATTIYEIAGTTATLTAGGESYDGRSLGDSVCRGLAFSPEPARVARTLIAMSGGSIAGLDTASLLERARELPLQHGAFNIFESFKQLVSMIRMYEPHAEAMGKLALDDVLYRHIAMMLRPDVLFDDGSVIGQSRSRIDVACDYIKANLDRSISLTEIESVTGLSARALQYAFKKRFNCTPIAWLTEQRLDYARSKLLSYHSCISVSSVALDAGFSNFGKFSKKYRERFGELPSQTLMKCTL